MSRDKQIEGIVKDFCPLYQEYGSCKRCNKDLNIDEEPCYYGCVANLIIDYDYHKSSEVAEEIFEEFRTQMREKVTVNECMAKTFPYDADFYKGRADAYIDAINVFAELKKKYTESEKDK